MYDTVRMQQVQSPVIPIIGDLVRSTPGTISLGQGVVHYEPPRSAFEQVPRCLNNPENHKYHAVQVIPQLRELLREKLQRENGIPVESSGSANPDSSRLCVTAGGNMAFANTVPAIADPGDEIIILTPFYFNHEMAITIAGCKPVLVDTDENYQPVPDRIREAITSRTRGVLTVSPNNPTGAVYSETLLREINQLCREHQIYHIHDEAYEYFTYEDAAHFSPGSIEGASTYTISLYSLSKAYGFAGWRIGYMVYPAHLEMSLKKIQDTILICPPIISQYAAVGAIQAGSSYCRQWLQEYAEVRKTFLEELAQIKEFCTVPPARGAFYFFLKIKSPLDDMELAQRLVREYKVAVMPGQSFGIREGCYLRVAYGALRKESAVEGIHRLVRGLQEIAGA